MLTQRGVKSLVATYLPWAGQLSRVLASLVGCGVLVHQLSCTVHGAPDHTAGYSISAHGPLAEILGVAI